MMPVLTTATPQELHARKRAEIAEQQLALAVETIGNLTIVNNNQNEQIIQLLTAAAEQYAIIHGLNVKYDRLAAAARAYLRDAYQETRSALQELV